MFDTLDNGTADRRETELVALEVMINRFRHRQAVLIAEADADQTTLSDGCRTLAEWVTGRLDVDRHTARKLVTVARDHPDLEVDSEAAGPCESFDRTAATTRLAAAGASDDTVRRSRGLDVDSVVLLAGRHRRITAVDERDQIASRYVTLQPALDQSHWSLAGRLPALDGETVSRILDETADRFPTLPDGTREDRAARRADALVHHVTDTSSTATGDGREYAVHTTVFVDARTATPTDGEAGAWIARGPRVGPATLEQVLCEGTVSVVALTSDGTPLTVGTATSAIPPRTRDIVTFRDGGVCTSDGCSSRYRLQPHHIRARKRLGNHEPDNLTLLCFFHHHVVVHRRGFTIDPTSPPGRRRFLPPDHHRPGPDPPGSDPP